MTRHPLATSLSLALALGATAVAGQDKLTVYSGDFDVVSQNEGQPGGPGLALVKRRIAFDLTRGENEVSLTGLPRALDPGSVVLKTPDGVRLRGQRFDLALASQDELLRRALGQSVVVEQSVGDQRQSHGGTLVSAADGQLALRMADGRIKVISNYASFDLQHAPSGLASEPTLVWALASDRAGNQAFDLDYATAGMAWRAEYTADVRGQGRECRMDFDGAAMVVNRSGADFRNVMLTLVAGEPNRVGGGAVAMDAMVGKREMMVASAAPEARASGEYQAYSLPTAGTVPQGSVQRLPLVDRAKAIACERRYETSQQMGDWRPPHPIIDENFSAGDGQAQPVIATLRFANSKAGGLGLPLPAGRVRMFEGTDFLGESTIGHTPAGKDVTLAIGNVFDLSAERTRNSFSLDREGRTMTEQVTVLLKNAKKVAATVRVTERLGRWTEWDIVSSTVPADKRNAQTVVFDVPVPAGGETRFTYTVRYRWAADVKLP